MKRLFVGQRVRIVGHRWRGLDPHPAGLEGVLCKPMGPGAHSGREFEWCVSTTGGRRVLCDSDEVEPILPEGHKPSEFSFSELMDNLGVVVA